ncbi:unnamed protein product [Globisporangium polare]
MLSPPGSSPSDVSSDITPPNAAPDHEFCDGKRRKQNPYSEDELMLACPPSPPPQIISDVISETQQPAQPDLKMPEPNSVPALPTPPQSSLVIAAQTHMPGPGGAGSALFNAANSSVWTCSRHLPDNSNSNNSTKYTALISELRGTLDRGATRLDSKANSKLAIEQGSLTTLA